MTSFRDRFALDVSVGCTTTGSFEQLARLKFDNMVAKKKNSNKQGKRKPNGATSRSVVPVSRSNRGSVSRPASMAFPMVRQVPLHAQKAVAEYLRSLAHPFTFTSRGVSGSHPTPQTAVIRRRALLPITITRGFGADIYVPLENANSPWVCVTEAVDATWAATRRTIVGNGSLSNLPGGSIARTVSAGIRFLPTSASQDVGGVFYFFRGASGVNEDIHASYPSYTEGALRTELDQAAGYGVVSPGKYVTFTAAPADVWYTVDNPGVAQGAGMCVTNTTVDTAPAGWPVDEHLRVYYLGPPNQTFMVEVVQNVEYYIDAHRDFMRPAVTHPQGLAIQQAVAAAMSTQSNVEAVGGHRGFLGFLQRATQTIEAATGTLIATGKAAYVGKKLYDGVSAMLGGAEAAMEAGAIVAL